MRSFPVLLLIVTALSGCSDGGAQNDALDTGDMTQSMVEAPTWSLGQYWSYTDSLGQAYSLVVAEDQGGDWVVLPNDKQIARFDALFDISFVGKTRKSDLAGSQGSDRIQFYDFPLVDGKSWNTDWDGEGRTAVAHAQDDGTFHVVVHQTPDTASPEFATYTYDPTVQHFSRITFFDENGTVGYDAELTGQGPAFSGTLYRFGAASDLFLADNTGPGISQGIFSTTGEPGELFLRAILDCNGEQGAILFAIQPPQEDGSAPPTPPIPGADGNVLIGNDSPCPEATDDQSILLEDPDAGDWRFDAVLGTVGGGKLQVRATWTPREDITF